MPSFSRPSLMMWEYSSISSVSSTALGSLSIGACVCDGVIIGRRGLSEKLGSRVPMLEHCWHTIRVAPSTRTFRVCRRSRVHKSHRTRFRIPLARTLEIGSQDAYVGIGSRMPLQLVKPRLNELRRIRVVAN